jgi:hypothetical protein
MNYKNVHNRIVTAMSNLTNDRDRRVLLAELDLEFCRRSAAYFIFRHCKTINRRPNKKLGEKVVGRFPRRRYLWLLIKSFEEHRGITVVSKSRQLIASWLYCALFLWEAMFHPARSTMLHSTDEWRVGFGVDDSLMNRILFIYGQLPDYIQERCPMRRTPSQHPTVTFYHPAQKGMKEGAILTSQIVGVPDVPAKILNTLAPTGIFNDEVSLQKKPATFYTAAAAVTGEDCRHILVATATRTEDNGEARAWFAELWYGADASDDPKKAEPEPEELMPYRDSYVGRVLADIEADRTDKVVGDRMLGRRRRGGIITFMLYDWVDPKKGKVFAEEEKAKLLTEAAWEQEHNNNWYITDTSRHVWILNPKPYADIPAMEHFREVYYDKTQKPPFDVLYVAVDFRGHAAATFCQKQQHPRAVKGYQFAILGELDVPGAHAPVFFRELFRRWREWFGLTPYRCYPDVAGRQGNWQTLTTDLQLLTKTAHEEFDRNFTTVQARIGRKEGISELSEKCVEIIGYEADGTPIPGLVINRERAPVTTRALSGALIQDADGCIDKKRGNSRYEHVADCMRYTSFRCIRFEDIVKLTDLVPKDEPRRPTMTRDQRIAAILENQADQAERLARSTNSRYRRVYGG